LCLNSGSEATTIPVKKEFTLPEPRIAAEGFGNGTHVCVIGGGGEGGKKEDNIKTTWCYNKETRSQKNLVTHGDDFTGGYGQSVVHLIGTAFVYIIGGWDGNYLNTIRTFNTMTGAYHLLPITISKRGGACAKEWHDPRDGKTKIVVFGGGVGDRPREFKDDVHLIDTTDNTIQKLQTSNAGTDSPVGVQTPFCGVFGDSFIVGGGKNAVYSRQLWKLDLTRNTWTQLPDLPFDCYQCPFFEMEGLNEPKEETLVALDGENNYWNIDPKSGNVNNVTSRFERVEGLDGIVGTAFVDSERVYIFVWQKNTPNKNYPRSEVYALERKVGCSQKHQQ